MKNSDVVKNFKRLTALSDISMPAKAAFLVGVNVRALLPIYESIKDAQSRLVDECAYRDENGKTVITENSGVRLSQDKLEYFHAQLEQMMSVESEVVLKKISIESLGDIKVPPELLNIPDIFA